MPLATNAYHPSNFSQLSVINTQLHKAESVLLLYLYSCGQNTHTNTQGHALLCCFLCPGDSSGRRSAASC